MNNGLWPSYWLIYQYMTSINYAPSFTWNYTTIDYMATNARTGGDVGGYDPSSYYAATFGPAINFAVGQPAAESSPGFQRGGKQDATGIGTMGNMLSISMLAAYMDGGLGSPVNNPAW